MQQKVKLNIFNKFYKFFFIPTSYLAGVHLLKEVRVRVKIYKKFEKQFF